MGAIPHRFKHFFISLDRAKHSHGAFWRAKRWEKWVQGSIESKQKMELTSGSFGKNDRITWENSATIHSSPMRPGPPECGGRGEEHRLLNGLCICLVFCLLLSAMPLLKNLLRTSESKPYASTFVG
jgi:hypothetical protein